MEKTNSDEDLKEINRDSSLCQNCRHYDYCIIRRFGPIYYCEMFDFKEEEKNCQ